MPAPALPRPAPAPDVPLPPSDEGGRIDPATFDIPQIQAAYRKVLSRWAGGGGDTLGDLATLETGVVGADGSGLSRLFKAEAQVVRELEERQPDVLLPVLVLHHDTYAAYRGRNNPYLSVHARNMVQTVAEIYAGHDPSHGEGAATAAARVLVSLGGFLQEASLPGFSANLYARALELDPKNPVALLGLGALFEKSGKYETAAGYLTRLVEAYPDDTEGRLRLALCLARSGKPEEGRKRLEALLSDESAARSAAGPGGWVADLASQELAAAYAEQGECAKARAVLERAVERFPGDARLYVQLASVLERLGQPGAALEAAGKAVALPPERGDSSRFRYNRFSPDSLERLRTALHETADARLAALSQALATTPAGERR